MTKSNGVRTMTVAAMAMAMAAAMAALPAGAQDDKQDDKAENKGTFDTTISIGVTLTDGNSETLQGNASVLGEGEKPRLGSVRVGAEAKYAESTIDGESQKTVENAKAFANVRKTLSEMTFASMDATALYDDMMDLDYRFTIGPGGGAYFVKTEATKLSAELGVAFVAEKLGGESDEYVALHVGERFDRQLSATAKLWQSFDYFPRIDDFNQYFLTAELGVEAALNSHMNLRLVLQDKYESRPAEGRERNDLTLIAGISMKL